MGKSILSRLTRNKNGNVAVVAGLATLPMVYLTGMGVDYTTASYRQGQMNAIADAAALAALKPALMAQPDAASIAAATTTFNAQASTIKGIQYNANNLTVTAADLSSGVSVKRTVNVTYTALSPNAFGGILGQPAMTISGSSQATATAAPNIDFYLLLDDSPSMAIAATPAGIQTMVGNTPSQGGCAFACHQTNPGADNLGNPGGIDNYQLARNLGVTLRIDMLRQATQNLMTTASSIEQTDNAQYRMGIYTFDYAVNTIQTLTTSLTTAQNAAANINVLPVYKNNWLTSTNNNSDADTNFDNAFTKLDAAMPAPGNGTNAAGDTPQEVLFLVTDGVEDEATGSGRQESLINLSQCTAIKNRGIRIAVLYTTYLPLPTNTWYNTHIAPFQSQIAPTMESCASPGLFFEVESGGDISAAMSALFQTAVQTAYLSK